MTSSPPKAVRAATRWPAGRRRVALASAGPDLTHVASRRTLAADTIANTPELMTEWLRDPDEVKEGTTMPAPELTESEIRDLVAYLQGLE